MMPGTPQAIGEATRAGMEAVISKYELTNEALDVFLQAFEKSMRESAKK